ncbi:hypothetical protein NL64_04520 [Pseudomonas fluorescens]|nr:hypothetical protein NL64_04520 [Pseudomonas fluorescens]
MVWVSLNMPSTALVGAGLLAMVVNDDACGLVERGVLESIASKPAPTKDRAFEARAGQFSVPTRTAPRHAGDTDGRERTTDFRLGVRNKTLHAGDRQGFSQFQRAHQHESNQQ